MKPGEQVGGEEVEEQSRMRSLEEAGLGKAGTRQWLGTSPD